jgi:hypothetical protein
VKDPPPGASVREVIPGMPEQLDELIARFESYVDGATVAARGLRSMDSGGWVGEAADAFWDSVGDVLRRVDGGAIAFGEAVLALQEYTATLRAAQVDARRALALFDDAERESRLGVTQLAADEASGVVTAMGIPESGVYPADPGEELRQQARNLLAEARSSVVAAAIRAADRLNQAAERAPDRPSWLARRWHNVTEFAGGAAEATAGMATFAFKLSPAYALANPEGFVENGKDLAEGLAYGATHPVDFAKAVVDWDTWAKSPGRALGHLLPAVALAVGSAGAGTVGEAGEAAAGLRAAGATARGLGQAEEVAVAVERRILDLPTPESWGRAETLTDHVARHGADFGLTEPTEYAREASRFFQQGLKDGLPAKVDPRTGVVRVYDPATNTFGAYNPDGTARTLYRLDPAMHGYPSNWDYWIAQPGATPWGE